MKYDKLCNLPDGTVCYTINFKNSFDYQLILDYLESNNFIVICISFVSSDKYDGFIEYIKKY